MTELIQQIGVALERAQQLMGVPAFRETVTDILDWIGKKVFSNKKSAKEKLALIEQQKADAEIINSLKTDLEFVLKDNKELQKELTEKVQKIEKLSEEAGVSIQKHNTLNITGSGKIVFQDVAGNSMVSFGNQTADSQPHCGSDDSVAGNKVEN